MLSFKRIRILFAVTLALAGSIAGFSLFAPHQKFDEFYATIARPMLLDRPSMVRVMSDFPEVELELRAGLELLFRGHGANAALMELLVARDAIFDDAIPNYVGGARDQDLVDYAAALASILATLKARDNYGCVRFVTGAKFGQALTPTMLTDLIGPYLNSQLSGAMDRIIAYSTKDAFAHNRLRGQSLMNRIGASRASLITGSSAEVVAGMRVPNTEAEAQAACAFHAAFYADISRLPKEDAAVIVREMLDSES